MSAYAQRVSNFHLVVAGLIAAAIAAALVGLAAQGTDAPVQLERLRPAGSLIDFPVVFQPQEAEAQTVLPQVAPRRSGGRTAPQVVQQPAEPAERPQSGAGDTDVAVQNGTSDTTTESGGATVSNNTVVHSSSGVSNEDEQDPAPAP